MIKWTLFNIHVTFLLKKKRYLQWKKLFRLLECSSNKEKEEPILVLIWYHCEPPFWNLYFWECRFMIWNTYFIRFSGAHFSEEKKTSLQSFTLALLWNNLPFLVEYPFQLEMHHITDLQRVANAKSGRYDIFNII